MEKTTFIRNVNLIVNRYFLAIVIVLVVVILAGGYWFFIKGTVDKIRVVGVSDINNKQMAIDQQKRSIEKLHQLKAQYESVDYQQLQHIQAILPPADDIPYVVIKLKTLIQDSGLVLESIDSGAFIGGPGMSAVSAGQGIQKLNITVSFKGLESYDGLKSFLDSLSGTVPLFELNALSYVPESSEYTLNLTTYYQ
ncbi:MAG: hypothetical protein WC544_04670 [Patescibacteria group bacterium]